MRRRPRFASSSNRRWLIRAFKSMSRVHMPGKRNRTSGISLSFQKSGSGKISNRGHFSDSERFISTRNDLQEHGRHATSLQDSLRHPYCVPRCVPRFSGNLAKLITEWSHNNYDQIRLVGSIPFLNSPAKNRPRRLSDLRSLSVNAGSSGRSL